MFARNLRRSDAKSKYYTVALLRKNLAFCNLIYSANAFCTQSMILEKTIIIYTKTMNPLYESYSHACLSIEKSVIILYQN